MLFYILILFFINYTYGASVSKYFDAYKDYSVYEISGTRVAIENVSAFLEQTNGRFVEERSDLNTSQILIAPELKDNFEKVLEEQKLSRRIITNDYSEILRKEKANSGDEFSWDAYYDIDDINEYLKNMSEKYPNMTELIEGGDSYEGRKLVGLRINNPKGKEGKHAFFIEAGIHAREWIAPAAATYFINQLLNSSDPEIISLRDSLDWHIFPSVNPDGYHYSHTESRFWRKTRSKNEGTDCVGADPNRNWGYQWMEIGASSNPCRSTYAGSKAFSEIETRSLAEYIKKVENLSVYVSLHSYGQMFLLPYSASEDHHDNYDDMVQIANTSISYGQKTNPSSYNGPGTAAEILYAVGGGSMDWVKHELGTDIVCTYELTSGGFDWPPEKIKFTGEEVTQLLLGLVTGAKDLGYLN